VNFQALLAAVDAGDLAAVQRLAKARPDWINHQADFRGSVLHRAVLQRNVELTRVLVQLGADARAGIWPHRDATSPYALAVDREYGEIVAAIEGEEESRRAQLSQGVTATGTAIDALWRAIAEGRAADAIVLLEADPALIGACDLHGVTPLHLAAFKHDPGLVGWLLDHGASPGALASRSDPRCDDLPKSGKTPLDFAAIVAGWAPEGSASFFYFMENVHVDPARFYETACLLFAKGAALTPRAAVALGDCEPVLRMHREGRLPNEIHIFRGGLLGIAVRVNRLDMVATLLDLGLDPNESDGGESSGMPLWFAFMCGRHEIAELLLTRGANADAVVYACGDSLGRAEDERMKALLRKHGARPTVESVSDTETAQAILDGTVTAYCLDGAEPLTPKQAAEFLCGGAPEFIRMCLPHITRKRDDPWWNSAIMTANLPEGLKLVLDHGVDVDIPFAGGDTMLHHLATPVAGRSGAFAPPEEERCKRATMLLNAGASLTLRDSLLRATPLGWACRWGRIELARLYLERGADPVEADAEPWATPLAWATKRGHHEIVQLLRSHGAGSWVTSSRRRATRRKFKFRRELRPQREAGFEFAKQSGRRDLNRWRPFNCCPILLRSDRPKYRRTSLRVSVPSAMRAF
jgi:ankyrin repeat protein